MQDWQAACAKEERDTNSRREDKLHKRALEDAARSAQRAVTSAAQPTLPQIMQRATKQEVRGSP